jgi:hypothetical protein
MPCGFILVAAGEVDLLLCRRSLGDHHAGLRSIAVAGNDAREDCAEHQRRRDNTLSLAGMDGARNVALCNVRDLVGQHPREFVFVARGLQQPGVHADKAAGEGKGVDIRIVDDEELEALAAVVGVSRDPAANFVDVLGNERVLDDRSAESNLRHDCSPEPGFVRLGQHGIGRASHVRQLDIVGPGAAGDCQQQGR